MTSCSLSSITWFSDVTYASLRAKLIRAVCGNGARRTMWFCALCPAQTSSCGSCCRQRWYPCVVRGSPKSLLAALWRETWAPGRGSPAASLTSAAKGGERRERQSQCTAVGMSMLKVAGWISLHCNRETREFRTRSFITFKSVKTHYTSMTDVTNSISQLCWSDSQSDFSPCHRNVMMCMFLIERPSRCAALVSVQPNKQWFTHAIDGLEPWEI